MDASAINIQDIISIYKGKGKGRLILILDACRSDFGLSKGYFSEITAAEDVYIAYGTQFQHPSIGIDNRMWMASQGELEALSSKAGMN